MFKKRMFAVAVVVLLATSMSTVMFNVQPAKAESGAIYIRADGSIDPPTAPISSVDNVTYTFTGNISDSIVIERNNIVVDGADCTVSGFGWGNGITLTDRNNVTVRNMKIIGFAYGILLDSSSNNTVSGNNVTSNNEEGIRLDSSSGNTLSGNNVTSNNGDGIYLDSSSGNTLSGNNVTSNKWGGISLDSSSGNTLSGNDVANNYVGILLGFSSNNVFYHNNFINNTQHAYITQNHANVWDDGYPSGGNYWSNYAGVDVDGDGIGDTPYTIYANSKDRDPLMGMFNSFNTSIGCNVDVISNSTIDDFKYSESNGTIVMHVSNMTSNQTFGFVRICIPHALMNETYQVIINGGEPYYVNYTLYDNGTHRWMYFSYQHSTLEVVIIPEFPSFMILPLFMIFTMLAVVFLQRKNPEKKQKNNK